MGGCEDGWVYGWVDIQVGGRAGKKEKTGDESLVRGPCVSQSAVEWLRQ